MWFWKFYSEQLFNMKINLNNREEVLDTKKDILTIKELFELKKFTFKNLVVKINGHLIKRDEYISASFKDGDKVDVIHMISGG
jgi:sulfur carrier protein